MKIRLNFLFAGLILVGIVQTVYFYPHLPETVASHFGAGGSADDWISRQLLVLVQSLTLLVSGIIYVLAGVLHLPAAGRTISLPNRDFWLAPQRKQATEAFIRSQARWFLFYTLLFLLVVFQLLINANLGEHGMLAETQMWAALFIYGVYLVIWLLRFYRRFSIKRDT